MMSSSPAQRNHHGYVDLSPAEVDARRGELRLVDVREHHEYHGDLGHIPDAELVPLSTLADVAGGWNQHEEIVLVCRSGGRSARAAATLARLGFTRVHNMLGGMLRWTGEGRATRR